jgi:hypothetical protein
MITLPGDRGTWGPDESVSDPERPALFDGTPWTWRTLADDQRGRVYLRERMLQLEAHKRKRICLSAEAQRFRERCGIALFGLNKRINPRMLTSARNKHVLFGVALWYSHLCGDSDVVYRHIRELGVSFTQLSITDTRGFAQESIKVWRELSKQRRARV